jgi:hypothetical protein
MAGVTNPTDFKTTLEAGSTKNVYWSVRVFGRYGSAYFNVTSGRVILFLTKTKLNLIL